MAYFGGEADYSSKNDYPYLAVTGIGWLIELLN